ncbi:MAG: hypothetical protein F4051_10070 [Boseongicola sp. SB0670_bin_30]|nr:hypothetical protein [Boseongicola sp. SB0670_bin_30]
MELASGIRADDPIRHAPGEFGEVMWRRDAGVSVLAEATGDPSEHALFHRPRSCSRAAAGISQLDATHDSTHHNQLAVPISRRYPG